MSHRLSIMIAEASERGGLLVFEALRREARVSLWTRMHTAVQMEPARWSQNWDSLLCTRSWRNFDGLHAAERARTINPRADGSSKNMSGANLKLAEGITYQSTLLSLIRLVKTVRASVGRGATGDSFASKSEGCDLSHDGSQ